MRIVELRLHGFRNLQALSWRPGPGLNLISGLNGAGKTSLVEAVHLLSHGRSFRCAQPDILTQRGAVGFELFAECTLAANQSLKLGMARADDGWVLRRDLQPVATLVEFIGSAAVVTIEPASSNLVIEGSEPRRRFLDWLLFHVEPSFLSIWRRYMRALRQRNAALRVGSGLDEREAAAWEPALVEAGTAIDRARRELIERLAPAVRAMLEVLSISLPLEGIRYRSGWGSEPSLADALASGRASDMERRFTQRGPHRADWRLDVTGFDGMAQWSRGQVKLLAIACLLGQACLHREQTGQWPVLIFDDLASELDAHHRTRVLEWLSRSGAQVLITGTAFDPAWRALVGPDGAWFHVEQGQVTALL